MLSRSHHPAQALNSAWEASLCSSNHVCSECFPGLHSACSMKQSSYHRPSQTVRFQGSQCKLLTALGAHHPYVPGLPFVSHILLPHLILQHSALSLPPREAFQDLLHPSNGIWCSQFWALRPSSTGLGHVTWSAYISLHN